MHCIKFLGTNGSRVNNGHTTCIQVTKNTLIDAGNIMESLGENAVHINAIFFSHSHLDHIIDSAFLIDNFFVNRTTPLRLYGLNETLDALKKHLFNNVIWPDFSAIHLPGSDIPALEFIPIHPNERYEIEMGVVLTPISINHSVPTCGYIIEHAESALLFTSDTFKNDQLWDILNQHRKIKALVIDVSFPNRLKKIAAQSKHLTPHFLEEELQKLHRDDLRIYVNHLKPFYYDEILLELEQINIPSDNILKDGDALEISTGNVRRTHTSLYTTDGKIEKLIRIGTALSGEDNLDILLEMIVSEARALTNADGGTLYLIDQDHLAFKVVQTDSLGIRMGGTSGEITWEPLNLYLPDGSPNTQMVAATCALENTIINIPDVYEAIGFSFEGTKKFDAGTNYRSKSMLVIPLKDHEHQIIGVLQLLNKIDHNSREKIPFDGEDEAITLSFASQAAVAITNRMLIQGLENLLEAFLKSIIFAISKKSPYTAGHIRRMVKLSLMMADAVHKDISVYPDKKFTPEEMKQINFAALMHDIGKLAIPEAVMDKSTKLESMYDRIEVVEGRIKRIQQALEIEYLNSTIRHLRGETITDFDLLQGDFDTKIAELNDYFEIIEQSNLGAEFFSNEKVEKIKYIAQKRWEIGGEIYMILSDDEAYALCTQKGTLTTEEREIINSHAEISVDILNKLPFPRKYKEIPQISGNHHEKINGKGYPQGLKGDEISFEARILAIADIFEALTASDRPYKKGNPLSSAMKILYFMAKDEELDPQLVKFFYESKIYLKYAKAFLPQSSIDEVNLDFSNL